MFNRVLRVMPGWMKVCLWAAALGIAVLVASQAAMAAPAACGRRTDIVALLAKQYQEAPIAMAIDHNGNLVEVLSSRSGSTWSVIVTTPHGMSCLVASGEDWQDLKAIDEDGPQVSGHRVLG